MKDPSERVKDLAGKVIDIVKNQTTDWTEGSEVMQLALGYMLAAIKTEEERAYRVATLANGAIHRANQMREAAEGIGVGLDPPPITRQ